VTHKNPERMTEKIYHPFRIQNEIIVDTSIIISSLRFTYIPPEKNGIARLFKSSFAYYHNAKRYKKFNAIQHLLKQKTPLGITRQRVNNCVNFFPLLKHEASL